MRKKHLWTTYTRYYVRESYHLIRYTWVRGSQSAGIIVHERKTFSPIEQIWSYGSAPSLKESQTKSQLLIRQQTGKANKGGSARSILSKELSFQTIEPVIPLPSKAISLSTGNYFSEGIRLRLFRYSYLVVSLKPAYESRKNKVEDSLVARRTPSKCVMP